MEINRWTIPVTDTVSVTETETRKSEPSLNVCKELNRWTYRLWTVSTTRSRNGCWRVGIIYQCVSHWSYMMALTPLKSIKSGCKIWSRSAGSLPNQFADLLISRTNLTIRCWPGAISDEGRQISSLIAPSATISSNDTIEPIVPIVPILLVSRTGPSPVRITRSRRLRLIRDRNGYSD